MVCRQAAFRKPGAQHKVGNSLVTIPAGAGVGQARGVAETEERIHRGDRAVSTLLDKEVRRGDFRQSLLMKLLRSVVQMQHGKCRS